LTKRTQAVDPSDRDLVTKAKLVAGGGTKLADKLGVSKQALSEWGRTRPIPRHARARLQDIVRGDATEHETVGQKTDETPWGSLAAAAVGTGLRIAPPLEPRRTSNALRGWQRVGEEEKNEIRNYVRHAALIATAIKQLLSTDAAEKVIATLSAEVSASVNDRLLHRRT